LHPTAVSYSSVGKVAYRQELVVSAGQAGFTRPFPSPRSALSSEFYKTLYRRSKLSGRQIGLLSASTEAVEIRVYGQHCQTTGGECVMLHGRIFWMECHIATVRVPFEDPYTTVRNL